MCKENNIKLFKIFKNFTSFIDKHIESSVMYPGFHWEFGVLYIILTPLLNPDMLKKENGQNE